MDLEKSGAGVFSTKLSEVISLRMYITVFQADFVAIAAAVFELHCNTIWILSDRQVAFNAIPAFKATFKVVAVCKKISEIIWIPGQCKVDGNHNEEAEA